jgi:hypothetical protein
VTQEEIQKLEKELAAAKVEIQTLRLRLDNLTFILSEEMTGRLPKLELRRPLGETKSA